MSNIIVFPKAKKGAPANTIEEILENVEIARREQVEFLIDETLSIVFSRCYGEGFDLTQDNCVKTTALVVEALRAALFNTAGIGHALHAVANEIFADEAEAIAQTEKISLEEDLEED